MSRPEGSRNHNNAGTPKLRGKSIVAVRKNEDGDILDFKMEAGEIVSYDEAIQIAEAGEASGLISQWGRYRKILRSSPDGRDNNDLDNLPTFE